MYQKSVVRFKLQNRLTGSKCGSSIKILNATYICVSYWQHENREVILYYKFKLRH